MRHAVVQSPGIHDNIVALKMEGEAIQTPGSRAIQVFAVGVVMRAVTGAFEAQTVVTERHCAAQMHAALIQRDPAGPIRVFQDGLLIELIVQSCPF